MAPNTEMLEGTLSRGRPSVKSVVTYTSQPKRRLHYSIVSNGESRETLCLIYDEDVENGKITLLTESSCLTPSEVDKVAERTVRSVSSKAWHIFDNGARLANKITQQRCSLTSSQYGYENSATTASMSHLTFVLLILMSLPYFRR